MRVLFGNKRLPDVARRKLLRARGLRFHQRLLIFFVLFLIAFGAYMMAFVPASDWGVGYGNKCLSFCGGIGRILSDLCTKVPSEGVHKIGEGIAKMLSNQFVAVIVTSALLSGAVAVAASILVWLRSLVGIIRGKDGSHAELYDETTEGAGVPGDAREFVEDDVYDSQPWVTDIESNPYSRVPA